MYKRGPVDWVFTYDPRDLGSIQKTLKMVLDTSLLNTQQYKVHIKGKVEQSRERSSTLLHLGVVAIEKGAFWSPSTTVANFTTMYKCPSMFHEKRQWRCTVTYFVLFGFYRHPLSCYYPSKNSAKRRTIKFYQKPSLF